LEKTTIMSQSICSICENPISSAEIIINSEVKLCQNCSNCSICKSQVTIDQIRNCLAHGRDIKHDTCTRVPHRRCIYLDERGTQCDTWFKAVDSNKLCEVHRNILSSNDHINEENKAKYIDLVNDERAYCYHFLDGEAQCQKQDLIFQFKDDESGTIFDKLDSHIAFIEKVIEDMKARLHSARAAKSEALDSLTEEERVERRKVKIDKAFKPEKTKAPSLKSDPIGHLVKKNNMSKQDASDLLSMDTDVLLAKFALAKKNKELK
jgi:hypothetical protein